MNEFTFKMAELAGGIPRWSSRPTSSTARLGDRGSISEAGLKVNVSADHPFAHVAATYEGEAWDELLQIIRDNRNRDEVDTVAE